MKALIKIGERCNQACRFCHRGSPGRVDVPRARIDALIDRAAALGHRMVVLSGGEATLRTELLSWAERTAARGLDFGLVTNGTLLDRAAVETLVRHRLRYVHLSLHGGTAEVHESLVRARSFERVRNALRALDGRGLELWVNCVVARPNLERLREVADAVAPFRDAGLKFSLVEPRGAVDQEFDALVPMLPDATRRVADALDHARRMLGANRRLAHDGFPLCLLTGLDDLRGDLRTHGFASMAEVGEDDLHPVDERNAIHPDRCRPCVLQGRCPGLFHGYHARFGEAELRPVTGRPRSNSFHYVYERRVPATAGACPVEAVGIAPWDRGRHLFVRNGDRVGLFHTQGRDLSDVEIEDAKLRSGQLYFDASRGGALDDFARQLVKLRRADLCKGCMRADSCTGLYEPVFENVFARDDARVLGILSGLSGDVLDVGCGEGRYGDELEAAARSGRLRYVGLEPDLARAARLRARWSWATIVAGTAEDLPFVKRRFDHVVVLRSWNHLRDPEVATGRLLAVLRHGGTLMIVDNEVFGLARTRADAARAERSSARFEHYRNDRAADAHAVVTGVAPELRLLERCDVAPETSNQWLLRYAVELDGRANGDRRPAGAPDATSARAGP